MQEGSTARGMIYVEREGHVMEVSPWRAFIWIPDSYPENLGSLSIGKGVRNEAGLRGFAHPGEISG